MINDILNECRQHTIEMKGQLSAEDMKTLRTKEIVRIFIVNFGFFSALGFMAPLVSASLVHVSPPQGVVFVTVNVAQKCL